MLLRELAASYYVRLLRLMSLMMVILNTIRDLDLALDILCRLRTTVILKTKRALDFLYRLRMMTILMTRLALGLALAFLTISKKCTVMVIFMTSLAMVMGFLKVSKDLKGW